MFVVFVTTILAENLIKKNENSNEVGFHHFSLPKRLREKYSRWIVMCACHRGINSCAEKTAIFFQSVINNSDSVRYIRSL